jgi:hypothetical protein
MSGAVAPAVLVFDDDPAVLDWVRMHFHTDTPVGIVTAGTLSEARKLISERRVQFVAVVSDMSVAPEKHDKEHGLQSGIDLLQFASRERPDVLRFAISIWGDMQTRFLADAIERGLKIQQWFQKSAPNPFWMDIAREVYPEKKQRSVSAKQHARLVTQPGTKKTYLQSLPEPFEVVFPIEVICRKDEDFWLADATALGLLQPGIGETIEEALDDLGELIVEQYENFELALQDEVSTYAESTFKALKDHVRRKAVKAA